MRDLLAPRTEQQALVAASLRAEMFSNARQGWGFSVLLLIVGFCVLQSSTLNVPLAIWAASGIAVSLLLLPIVITASRKNGGSVNKTFFLVGTFLSGLIWGVFAVVSLPLMQSTTQLSLLMLPLLLCLVAVITYSAWLPAFHAFIWPLSIVFITTLALYDNASYLSMLPVALCFIGFCITFAHRTYDQARTRATEKLQYDIYVRETGEHNVALNRARVEAQSDADTLRSALRIARRRAETSTATKPVAKKSVIKSVANVGGALK